MLPPQRTRSDCGSSGSGAGYKSTPLQSPPPTTPLPSTHQHETPPTLTSTTRTLTYLSQTNFSTPALPIAEFTRHSFLQGLQEPRRSSYARMTPLEVCRGVSHVAQLTVILTPLIFRVSQCNSRVVYPPTVRIRDASIKLLRHRVCPPAFPIVACALEPRSSST
ncbi:hypothetical protein L226DRAFT_295540 [Lentinus tigrinus ALCF2SS1-7]|uniref:uncharacterized protein n=1 Tax=Lentinus tigrinus ALCF2SS1-7 TaxID=1328758 RepID=UPI00116605E1|nr:hypothetical protein L226DRAFT_295540 [Lentinus tigrinus ALCF2SS1-7]